ncbi:MAG: hypothetical protein ACNA7G_12565 [Methylobacter sp.]
MTDFGWILIKMSGSMRKKQSFRKKAHARRLKNRWDLEYFHSLWSLGARKKIQTPAKPSQTIPVRPAPKHSSSPVRFSRFFLFAEMNFGMDIDRNSSRIQCYCGAEEFINRLDGIAIFEMK